MAVVTSPMAPLGEVATIERRGVDPREINTETRYLGLEHIERGGRIRGHHTVQDANLASTKFMFDEGHVLFGKLRPNLGKVARPNFQGVCSTDILPIRPGALLDRAYLHHYLAQPTMIEFAASRASGANLPRLSPTMLATFEVPLPALEQQRRIAAILDQADALRTRRRQALAHLDELTQSIFLDVFGDPVRNPKGWERQLLGEVVERIDSGKSPVCESRPAKDSEWGVLKLGAVTYGVFAQGENKAYLGDYIPVQNEIKQGDLLLARKNTRDLVGATALVDAARPGLLLPDLIFRLQVDPAIVSKKYLQRLLMTPSKRREVQSLASGSAGSMPNISKAKLRGLAVEIPPLRLQMEFAVARDCVRAQTDLMSTALIRSDAAFASLQNAAFSGRL